MLLIFDWDGTLCDSTATITRAMQAAAEDMGWQPLADGEIHNIIGLGLPEAIAQLYPAASDAGRQQLRDHYARHFVALDEANPAQLFPEVRATLDSLKARGYAMAVATGKSRRGLDRIFAAMGLEGYFDASRCADETASKPHPLMLEQLLQQFSLTPEAAVMVGDTEFDMAMAQAIAMPRIAVSYGAHHISRLTAYEPSLCLDRFSQLLDWPPLGVGCR